MAFCHIKTSDLLKSLDATHIPITEILEKRIGDCLFMSKHKTFMIDCHAGFHSRWSLICQNVYLFRWLFDSQNVFIYRWFWTRKSFWVYAKFNAIWSVTKRCQRRRVDRRRFSRRNADCRKVRNQWRHSFNRFLRKTN